MTKGKWWLIYIGVAVAGLVAVGLAVLPLHEIGEWMQLRLHPERFKADHLLRFERAGRPSEVVLLGTVHNEHLGSGSRYPLWELKSLILGVKPDLVFVEVKPEAAAAGRWAEGPVEMPFCALVAKEAGIQASGMDYWKADAAGNLFHNSGEREDRMFENIMSTSQSHKRVLIITGFSHVEGFSRRFIKAGFRSATWARADKLAVFHRDVPHVYPPDLRNVVATAIDKVRRGEGEGFDREWAEKRQRFLDSLPPP